MSACFSQSALAEKRVALIIGISKYQNVNHLTNPDNDAAMLAATFRKAKFDVVTLRTGLTASEMRRTLRHFGDQARDADIAVIYYAGHGIEVDGINYVVPADARLRRDTDVYDEAISVNRLLVAVEPAKRLRLIILDACRNNPFVKTMKRMIATRAIGRGLVKVEPASPNTMIAFAAKAGSTAEDGDGKDSPFAVALAAHLMTPGLDLRRAFGYVRDDVLKATGDRQEPFIYGSLGGDEVSLVPAPPVAKPRLPLIDPNEAIRRDYLLAEQVGTREAWHSFLASYGTGFYAKLAKAQLDKLAAEEDRTVDRHPPPPVKRVAPRRLFHRLNRGNLEQRCAAIAWAFQQICRHHARYQGSQPRHARCGARKAQARLPAGVRSRLQGGGRHLHADHLQGRLRAWQQQRMRENRAQETAGQAGDARAASAEGKQPCQPERRRWEFFTPLPRQIVLDGPARLHAQGRDVRQTRLRLPRQIQ